MDPVDSNIWNEYFYASLGDDVGIVVKCTAYKKNSQLLSRWKKRSLSLRSDGILLIQTLGRKKSKLVKKKLDLLDCKVADAIEQLGGYWNIQIQSQKKSKSWRYGFKIEDEASTFLSLVLQVIENNSNGLRTWNMQLHALEVASSSEQFKMLMNLPKRDWYSHWKILKQNCLRQGTVKQSISCHQRLYNLLRLFWQFTALVIRIYAVLSEEEKSQLKVPEWFEQEKTDKSQKVFQCAGILFKKGEESWESFKTLNRELKSMFFMKQLLNMDTLVDFPLLSALDFQGRRFVAYAISAGVGQKLSTDEVLQLVKTVKFPLNKPPPLSMYELSDSITLLSTDFAFEDLLQRSFVAECCYGLHVPADESLPTKVLSRRATQQYAQSFHSLPILPYIDTQYFRDGDDNVNQFNRRASQFTHRDLAGNVVFSFSTNAKIKLSLKHNYLCRSNGNVWQQKAIESLSSNQADETMIINAILQAVRHFADEKCTLGDLSKDTSSQNIIMNAPHLTQTLKSDGISIRHLPLIHDRLQWNKNGLKILIEAEITARTCKHMLRSKFINDIEPGNASWTGEAYLLLQRVFDIHSTQFWDVEQKIWLYLGSFASAAEFSPDKKIQHCFKDAVQSHAIQFLHALQIHLAIDFRVEFLFQVLRDGFSSHLLDKFSAATCLLERRSKYTTFGIQQNINAISKRVLSNQRSNSQIEPYSINLQKVFGPYEDYIEPVVSSISADIRQILRLLGSNQITQEELLHNLNTITAILNSAPRDTNLPGELIISYFLVKGAIYEQYRSYRYAEMYYGNGWYWLQYLYRPLHDGGYLNSFSAHPISMPIIQRLWLLFQQMPVEGPPHARQTWVTNFANTMTFRNAKNVDFDEFLVQIETYLLDCPCGINLTKQTLERTENWNNAIRQPFNGSVFVAGEIMGRGLEDSADTPENIPNFSAMQLLPYEPIWKVSCGNRHTALLSTTGLIYTFGYGEAGRLGHGTENSYDSPQVVNYFASQKMHISNVACGRDHTLAATSTGKLYSFGWLESGRGGTGDSGKELLPVHVSDLSDRGEAVVELACGREHSLVATAAGNVYGFGAGFHGRLGTGTQLDQTYPTLIHFPVCIDVILSISAGEAHSATVITAQGITHAFTWGFGGSGALGHGNFDSIFQPRCLDLDNIVEVSCGSYHTLFLLKDGTMYGCGDNNELQLETGDSAEQLNVPTSFNTDIKFKRITCGNFSSWGISLQNELYSWGNSIPSSTLHQLPPSIYDISSGPYHAVALSTIFPLNPPLWVSSQITPTQRDRSNIIRSPPRLNSAPTMRKKVETKRESKIRLRYPKNIFRKSSM